MNLGFLLFAQSEFIPYLISRKVDARVFEDFDLFLKLFRKIYSIGIYFVFFLSCWQFFSKTFYGILVSQKYAAILVKWSISDLNITKKCKCIIVSQNVIV